MRWTLKGDGTIDQTITDLENVSFTYEQEGLYYPTITVTDDQGYWYTDTIAINVLSLENIDALFNAKWGGLGICYDKWGYRSGYGVF